MPETTASVFLSEDFTVTSKNNQAIEVLPIYIAEPVFDKPVTANSDQAGKVSTEDLTRNTLEAVGMALTQAPTGFWLFVAAGAFGLALLTDFNQGRNPHGKKKRS